MPSPRFVLVAFALAVGVAANGCVQQPSAPVQQATPSYSCTPIAGGEPYSCYQHQHDEIVAQEKLYAEAEAVYRKYNAEDERIYRVGGVTEPTAVLLETATGEYLQEAMAEYRGLRKNHGGLVAGSYEVSWFRPEPDVVKSGFVATLDACVDISDASFADKSGGSYQLGEDSVERLYFVSESDHLRIGSADHKRVKSC